MPSTQIPKSSNDPVNAPGNAYGNETVTGNGNRGSLGETKPGGAQTGGPGMDKARDQQPPDATRTQEPTDTQRRSEK